MPNNGGEPRVNALPDREPVECIAISDFYMACIYLQSNTQWTSTVQVTHPLWRFQNSPALYRSAFPTAWKSCKTVKLFKEVSPNWTKLNKDIHKEENEKLQHNLQISSQKKQLKLQEHNTGKPSLNSSNKLQKSHKSQETRAPPVPKK